MHIARCSVTAHSHLPSGSPRLPCKVPWPWTHDGWLRRNGNTAPRQYSMDAGVVCSMNPLRTTASSASVAASGLVAVGRTCLDFVADEQGLVLVQHLLCRTEVSVIRDHHARLSLDRLHHEADDVGIGS